MRRREITDSGELKKKKGKCFFSTSRVTYTKIFLK